MAIYFASLIMLSVIFVVVMVLMGWEWVLLIPIKSVVLRCLYILVLMCSVWPFFNWLHQGLILDLVLWAFILVAVISFPKTQNVWGHRIVIGLLGLVMLPILGASMNAIYHQIRGQDLILYLLCLVWATDIGAYFTGKQFGSNKLIPAVSPGKTVEGSLGGVLAALSVAVIASYFFKPSNIGFWCISAMLISLMSMLGDLLISMLKRRCGFKDTGHIFPGHGGILDRLDSLIAAAPLFYFIGFMGPVKFTG
jgi:undecaprenyl diphosphate synthase/phosphatidate cytidylyltransferase